ncbi:MAG: hypothetical protein WAT67_15060 [Candidatus Contendobacter sp.]
MTQDTQKSLSSAFKNASGAGLKQFVADYRQQRQADIQELLRVLDEQQNHLKKTRKIGVDTPAWFAIHLLGENSAASAVPTLIQLIAVRDSSFSLLSNESTPHWNAFPAAVALANIGMPAILPLLELARTAAPDSTAFQLAGVTLEAIFGPELALAAATQYGQQHRDFAEKDRFAQWSQLIRAGHRHWVAYDAADFSPD